METDWNVVWQSPQSADAIESDRDDFSKPDELLEFVLRDIGWAGSILDIGAGSGKWAIPFSRVSKTVTALEESQSRLSVLRHNIEIAYAKNVRVIESRQYLVDENRHEVVCAHSSFDQVDMSVLINLMTDMAQRSCYLELRWPARGGIMDTLTQKIRGPAWKSHSLAAYRGLCSLGVNANVHTDQCLYRWIDYSLLEALSRARSYLHLEKEVVFDDMILGILRERLRLAGNRYIWPDRVHSALIWWHVPEPGWSRS